MKTMRLSLLVLALSSLLASCDKKTITTACKGNPNICMDVDSLNAQLKRRLDGKCVGYGYVIGVKGDVHTFNSGGQQRLIQDRPVQPFSVMSAFNPASLSKMITGITLMQLLNSKGIAITEPMWTYLPSNWNIGPNVKSITFQDLLTHKSGIRSFQYLMDYPAMRKTIDTGVTLTNKSVNQYDNMNFGLMRVLIPRIAGQNLTGTDDQLASDYGLAYEQYVNDHVFSVLGIPYLYNHPTDTDPALSYHFPDGGTNGTAWGDFTTNNAQAGWNISALQFSQVMRAAFYGTSLLPASVSQAMRDNVLAFDYFGSGTTPYFGSHYVSKNGLFPAAGNSGEFNGEFVLFDNDVTVTLFVNSQLNYPTGIRGLVIDAFDAAHK